MLRTIGIIGLRQTEAAPNNQGQPHQQSPWVGTLLERCGIAAWLADAFNGCRCQRSLGVQHQGQHGCPLEAGDGGPCAVRQHLCTPHQQLRAGGSRAGHNSGRAHFVLHSQAEVRQPACRDQLLLQRGVKGLGAGGGAQGDMNRFAGSQQLRVQSGAYVAARDGAVGLMCES